jgi:hypothetical protein
VALVADVESGYLQCTDDRLHCTSSIALQQPWYVLQEERTWRLRLQDPDDLCEQLPTIPAALWALFRVR